MLQPMKWERKSDGNLLLSDFLDFHLWFGFWYRHGGVHMTGIRFFCIHTSCWNPRVVDDYCLSCSKKDLEVNKNE